jgi:hypothetical protein
MSAVSDIIAIVIIVVMLLSGWALIQFNQLDQAVKVFESNKIAFEQHRISADFGEILQIEEPTIKMSVAQLMGDMIYSWSYDFNYYGQNVNRKEIVEKIFDSIYGKENYYMEIIPPKMKIRLYFIVDGSDSMRDDIDKLNVIIPDIKSFFRTKGDFIFEEKVFILKTNTNNSFDCTSIDIDCSYIEADHKIPVTNTGNVCPSLGVGIYNKYFVDSLKNPQSPYFVGVDKFPARICCMSNCSPDMNILKGEFYEDWATASAYVAKEVPEARMESEFPTVTFIFPASDELSSGSESDTPYSYQETGSNVRVYYKTCNLSNGNRSLVFVNHAISVLKNYDYRVVPIFTDPKGNGAPPICDSVGNLCVTSNDCVDCNGKLNCVSFPSSGLHSNPETINKIKEHMALLAGGDGVSKGNIIDCSSGGCDISLLKESIISTIDAVVGKKFEFGTKKDNAERYVVNKTLPLKDGTQREVKIWVYKKQEPYDVVSVSPLSLKPVALIGFSPLNPVIITSESNDVDVDFWSNSFDPLGNKIVSWVWRVDDSEPVEGKTFSKTFSVNDVGDHNVFLTVSNDKGVSNSVKISIRVSVYDNLKES